MTIMRFLYFTIVSTWCIIIIEDKLSYLMEVVTMNVKEFTINYRGVEITPRLEHELMRDVLHYEYCEYNVCVLFDSIMYHEMKFKEGYIERVKSVAIDDLRKRTLDEIFDNMGVR